MSRSKKYVLHTAMFTVLIGFLALHMASLDRPVAQNDAAELNNLMPGNGVISKSLSSYQSKAPVTSTYTQEASISGSQAENCQAEANHAKANGATEAAGQNVYYDCLRAALNNPAN